MTAVVHGGTDAGPAPRVDASTNANPLGPSPSARAALRADVHPYPDPAAAHVRAALAAHARTDVERVVVGAGATELLDRLVRVVGGPVLVEQQAFGEYAAAAARHGATVRSAPTEQLADRVGDAALVVVADPGSPHGRRVGQDRLADLAAACRTAGAVLVVDLAYAPLTRAGAPSLPADVVALHAPNKAHGCTGLRAGWLAATPALAARLRAAGVTWLVSTPGLAFLEATACVDADRWVATAVPTLLGWRDDLAADLGGLGLHVAAGDAPFLLASLPGAGRLAVRLRDEHGVKVRDCTSFGLVDTWRVAALPPAARAVLVDAVATLLTDERSEP